MSNAILQHSDDNGVLSVIASGDTVILACEHGHYWVLESTQYSKKTVAAALESRLSADNSRALLRQLM